MASTNGAASGAHLEVQLLEELLVMSSRRRSHPSDEVPGKVLIEDDPKILLFLPPVQQEVVRAE
jgi:hypothetical protein